MTRLLVTGASGVLGREIVPLLRSSGYEVFTTSRTGVPSERHLPADLGDAAQVDQLVAVSAPESVVHLAGGAEGDPFILFWNNVHATVNLLRALRDKGRRLDRLLVAGSAAEYGDGDGRPLDEDAPVRPRTPYGHAKAAQRHAVQALGPSAGSYVTHMRIFNVVSAELPESSALGNLRRQLLLGQPGGPVDVVCGNLDITRDFISARSVARAVLGILQLPEPPAAVNLCSGVPITLRELFKLAAERADRSPSWVPAPELMALPFSNSVIGDPALARRYGLWVGETADELAASLMSEPPE